MVTWRPKREESHQIVTVLDDQRKPVGRALYLRVFIKGYGFTGWFSECSAWLDSVEYEGRVVSGESEPIEWMGHGGFGPRAIGAGAFASVVRVLEPHPRVLQPVTQRSLNGGDVWDKPGVYTFNISARTKLVSRGAIKLTVHHAGTEFQAMRVMSAESRGLLRWW